MNKYYSKEIRKMTNKLLNEIRNKLSFLQSQPNFEYEVLNQSLHINDDEQFTNMLKKLGLLDDHSQRLMDIIQNYIYIQSYTDFYRMCRLQNKIDIEDSIFHKIDFEILLLFFCDPDIYVEMIKSIEEFSNLSAYDKIIITKLLTEKEHNKLKELNPFYEYEKNMYDITVTKEFILRHIDNWNKSFDLEKAIDATSDFILNLYQLDKVNIKTLFDELNFSIDENYQIFKDNLKKVLKKEYVSKQKIKK